VSDRSVGANKSLALELLLKRLRRQPWSRVLDLGPAVGANVEFLAQFQCRLHIADLYHSLRERFERTSTDTTSPATRLTAELPPVDHEPFDLILAWDLLNYLDPEEIRVIGEHLARICHRDGVVFLMISTARQIPNLPCRYSIVGDGMLRYDCKSASQRSAPGYKEPDLERLLPAFEVETSYLLRNGYQEYLLELRADAEMDRTDYPRPMR